MLPSASHATSVGCRNWPFTGGRGGVTRSHGSALSDASFLRPNTIVTRPSGLKRTIMSEPLSTAHRLSSLSKRTVWAYDQAYRPLPTSRRNLPVLSNNSTCAAVAPYAGPFALLPREKTAISPFELTATPDASPKLMSAGSFRNVTLPSNGISGTDGWANPGTAVPNSAMNTNVMRFIRSSSGGRWPENLYRIASQVDCRLSQPGRIVWPLVFSLVRHYQKARSRLPPRR